jgi:uncharacterized membrane protein YoaK (UPF0700 family)
MPAAKEYAPEPGSDESTEESGESSDTGVEEEQEPFSRNLSGGTTQSTATPQPPKPKFVRPRGYMLAVGVVLAVCAGAVNTTAFKTLGDPGGFVSHVTGSTTKVGIELENYLADRKPAEQWMRQVGLIFSFVFGAFLCGLLVDKNELHFGKSFYGVALVGNSALLCTTAFLGHEATDGGVRQYWALVCAAVACGLQNAMCTSHFGAVVRTTHVTGTATDIGSTAGRILAILLRRRCKKSRLTEIDVAEIDADKTKLLILLLMFFGFFLGAFFGAYLSNWHDTYAFFVPAAITGTTGLVYALFRDMLKKAFKEYLNKDEIMEEVRDVEHEVEHALEELAEIRQKAAADPTFRETAEDAAIKHVASGLKKTLAEIKQVEADLVHAPDPETVVTRTASRHTHTSPTPPV